MGLAQMGSSGGRPIHQYCPVFEGTQLGDGRLAGKRPLPVRNPNRNPFAHFYTYTNSNSNPRAFPDTMADLYAYRYTRSLALDPPGGFA